MDSLAASAPLRRPRLLRRFTIGLVVSALILVAGIVLAGLELSRSNWVHVDAVVIEVATKTSGARTSYRPTVAFEVGGDRHTVTAWSWTPDRVVVGQSLAARYDPADPAHATTGSWWPAAAIVGGAGVASGVYLVLTRRWIVRRRPDVLWRP